MVLENYKESIINRGLITMAVINFIIGLGCFSLKYSLIFLFFSVVSYSLSDLFTNNNSYSIHMVKWLETNIRGNYNLNSLIKIKDYFETVYDVSGKYISDEYEDRIERLYFILIIRIEKLTDDGK